MSYSVLTLLKYIFKPYLKHKYVTIYFSDELIHIIPSGKSKKYHIADIDAVLTIQRSDDINIIEKSVYQGINHCFTKISNDNDLPPLCKITGYKSYNSASRGYRVVCVEWSFKEVYTVTPTKKIHKKGYTHMEDLTVQIKSPKTGELGNILMRAFDSSLIISE